MTIEEARNLIGEAEDSIANTIWHLVAEVGIVPTEIELYTSMENITGVRDVEPRQLFKCRVKIEGMEL